MSQLIGVRRALISVSDKSDLIPFARRLAGHGAELISTGGTAGALEAAGVPVVRVEQVTGMAQMLGGRVKTLHPKIHGGLLALRDDDDHLQAMATHSIEPIDLVCVNLYPFEQTVEAHPDDLDQAIEQIDIGGPAMIRSGAKNHHYVAAVTDPSQYDPVLADMDVHGGATSIGVRSWLAAAAFARTAAYDAAIATWMSRHQGQVSGGPFPDSMILRYRRHGELRYGENPHQAAALYIADGGAETSVATARQQHGKALSFCNLYDASGALELIKEFDPRSTAAVAVVKHANPCGLAVAPDLAEAFCKAHEGDPLAAYGGIVACNRPIESATAKRISQVQGLDVILAPRFEPGALQTLQQRWKQTRLLEFGQLGDPADRDAGQWEIKQITGGLLVQDRDLAGFDPSQWNHQAGPAPLDGDCQQLVLALIAVKHLKSNAVCLVRDQMLVGAGAGQMDRLASCRLAIQKAGPRARGAYAASDGMFPFRDGPQQLLDAGVKAIVQPGGSRRDAETIEACRDAGVTLLLTYRRHFRH